ncbi:MAG: DNA translocase FtsK [Oscillospiraceae bacterium]
MATRGRPPASAAKKRTTTKKRKTAASARAQTIDRRWSLLLYGLGVLFIVMAFVPGESFWAWLRTNFLFGIFGICGWLLGPFLIYVGTFIATEKPFGLPIAKALFFMFALSGLVMVFSGVELAGNSFSEVAVKLFESGAASYVGGGFISLLFGGLLLAFAGEVAARIVMVLLFIGALMLFTGVTPGDVVRFFKGLGEKLGSHGGEQEYEEEYEEEAAAPPPAAPYAEPPAAQIGKRKNARIDIPLDGALPLSQPGPGLQEDVEILPGGTFGKKPLDELKPGAAPVNPGLGVQLGKVEDGARLLFGEDDPLAAKNDAAALRGLVYDYEVEDPFVPTPAEEPDLFGRRNAPAPVQVLDGGQAGEEVAGAGAVPQDSALAAMIDKAAAEKEGQLQPAADKREAEAPFSQQYRFPPIGLFDAVPQDDTSGAKQEMHKTADLLVSTLASFGVETRILDVSRGPSVTRYEIQPQAGVKISRITNLADDIALNLAAAGVRIEAPIPGKPAVGIEVPNKKKSTVSIRGILESPAFADSTSPLSIALGKDIAGECVVADLTKMPHLLVAGSTGSGKSVCINATIMSFLYKSSPEDVRLLLIDPKVVELAEYNGIPHLLMPVVTEPRKAAGALGAMVAEMERRYRLFAENNVRDIKTFNKLVARKTDMEKLPHIAIIIDELADLMMTSGKEVEDYICRIAQKARAAGMHLIVATQRPSVDVITGLIKANIPSRIAFSVSSQVDSRTILDGAGAEKLLGMGDMLFMPVGANKPVRVQGTYVKDKEITDVLAYIKKSGPASYDEGMIQEMEKRATAEGGADGDEGDADMLNDSTFVSAVEMALEAGQISTSHLQRRLRLGYARAGRIVDDMERLHIVGGPNGSKPREVLISRQQWLEMSMNNAPE